MTVHPAEEKEKKDDEDYDNDAQKDQEEEGDETYDEEEDEPFRADEVPENEREELRAELVAQQNARSEIEPEPEPEPDAEDEEQSEIAGLKKQIAALEEKAALGLSSRAVKALNPPWWSEHESFLPGHLLRPACTINPGLNSVPGEDEVRCVIFLFVLTSL